MPRQVRCTVRDGNHGSNRRPQGGLQTHLMDVADELAVESLPGADQSCVACHRLYTRRTHGHTSVSPLAGTNVSALPMDAVTSQPPRELKCPLASPPCSRPNRLNHELGDGPAACVIPNGSAARNPAASSVFVPGTLRLARDNQQHWTASAREQVHSHALVTNGHAESDRPRPAGAAEAQCLRPSGCACCAPPPRPGRHPAEQHDFAAMSVHRTPTNLFAPNLPRVCSAFSAGPPQPRMLPMSEHAPPYLLAGGWAINWFSSDPENKNKNGLLNALV